MTNEQEDKGTVPSFIADQEAPVVAPVAEEPVAEEESPAEEAATAKEPLAHAEDKTVAPKANGKPKAKQ